VVPLVYWRCCLGVGDYDQPNWYTVHTARGNAAGRVCLDEPFFILGPHCDNDLVRREARERVSDRQVDVGFPSDRFDRLAGKLLGRPLGHALGVTERALVVREPVENSLPNDGDHNLDPVGLPDLGAQGGFAVLDRADN
jgi:hypothetical protein